MAEQTFDFTGQDLDDLLRGLEEASDSVHYNVFESSFDDYDDEDVKNANDLLERWAVLRDRLWAMSTALLEANAR